MNKRVILVGPTASGKNFIKEKFGKKGFNLDVSYTSRNMRKGEKDGTDYYFISEKAFKNKIMLDLFYEWVQYGDNYYGTGLKEWEECDIFIMETDGINKIKLEDRKNSLVIYVNTPIGTRIERMKERGWNSKKIYERILVDQQKFKNFKNYDIEIISEKNNLGI
jgi:guanylate kinase